MKKWVYLILAFLILLVIAIASADVNIGYLFEKGNEAYLKENYAEAINQYESALSQGFESGALYYNLGNAYYRTGSIGRAILNYERALKWLPNDENVQFNLRLANLAVKDRIDVPPEFFLFRWLKSFTNLLPSKGWGMLLSIFGLLSALSFSVILLVDIKKYRSLPETILCLSLFMIFISSGAFISRHRIETGQEYGIVISYSVRSLAAPQEGSTELFVVHEGTKVRILDIDGEWSKIELIDGKQGWLQAEEIGRI